MRTYRIELKKEALKFIKSRNMKEQERIMDSISMLPDGTDIKKLEGYEKRYRLRLGNIRVIYDKFDDTLLILVVNAGNRGDVYK